jgi:GNAT superfamily N-acetyltransferase
VSVDDQSHLLGIRLAPASAAAPMRPWEPPSYARPETFDEQDVTLGTGPLAEVTVRRATEADADTCLRIIRGLPEYFTDDVPDRVRLDLARHEGWVLADDDVVGMAVVDRRSADAVEILWLAVDSQSRRTGVGTRLLAHVLDHLRRAGVLLVEAKTLDRSVDYPPYVATRAFWERRGFVQIDTIDPLPGWAPGNPCAFYVAALASTA